MKKLLTFLTILFLILSSCNKKEKNNLNQDVQVSQKSNIEKEFSIKEDAIGVFYLLKSDDPQNYKIKMAFPAHTVKGLPKPIEVDGKKYHEWTYKIKITSSFYLYDKFGFLTEVKPPPFIGGRFWCENDGGAQYRPEYIFEIEKNLIKRVLTPISSNYKLAGFSVLNQKLSPPALTYKDKSSYVKTTLKYEAKLGSSEKVNASIIVTQDTGPIKLGPYVELVTSKGEDDLICSGP